MFKELQKVINYVETHILENIKIENIAREVGVSSFYLQRSFQIVTTYSLKEYIRNRRLYLAARELIEGNEKIIDLAYKYGYETPESFTKAFIKFHNNSPSKVRKGGTYTIFNRMRIKVIIDQGEEMKVKITPMFPIKLIGFEKEFSFENSYQEIPKYWDEICEKYCSRIYNGQEAETPEEHAIVDNCIGEYALCLDYGDESFKYMIAGRYTGGQVPKSMRLIELEKGEWAVFECVGPNPKTLQEMNTKVFNEWIYNNQEYEIREKYSIEWYDCTGDMSDDDYRSAIWIPVKKR